MVKARTIILLKEDRGLHRNKIKRQHRLIALLLGTTTLLLTACSDNHAYEYSVDVPSSEWTPTDTLFYPIHVDSLPASYTPIERDYPYCLDLIVRSQSTYPAPILPLHVQLDKEYIVYLDLGDRNSVLDGDNWGSLYTKEFDVDYAVFAFPDTGNYVLKIWPEDTLQSVTSITAVLE